MNGVIVHGERTGWLILHCERPGRQPEYVVPEAEPPEVVPDFFHAPQKKLMFHKIVLVPIKLVGPAQVNDGLDGTFVAFVEPGTYKQGEVPNAMIAQWYHMYRRAFERWQRSGDRKEIL